MEGLSVMQKVWLQLQGVIIKYELDNRVVLEW